MCRYIKKNSQYTLKIKKMETKQEHQYKEKEIIVIGDRVCKTCEGLCHKNSFRDKFGQRKKYYCSEFCLPYNKENFDEVDVISIYAWNNPKLFNDVEQFPTKKEAMERIRGLLD